MRLYRLVALTLLLGCPRPTAPEAPAQAPDAVLELARARPIPDPLQGRFHIRVRSRVLDVAGSTNGVIIVDRPGQGHIAVMGPVGGPIFTLSSDGSGVSVVLPREERHLVALDAERVLEGLGAGLVELDDLFGLLVGDIPFDDARMASKTQLPDGRGQIVMHGPKETLVSVTLRTADGTPETLGVHRAGEAVLGATYSAFEADEQGALLPTAVAVEVPKLDLRVELTYRSWRVPDPVPPVFGLDAPAGFRTESLERAIEDLAAGVADQAAMR